MDKNCKNCDNCGYKQFKDRSESVAGKYPDGCVYNKCADCFPTVDKCGNIIDNASNWQPITPPTADEQAWRNWYENQDNDPDSYDFIFAHEAFLAGRTSAEQQLRDTQAENEKAIRIIKNLIADYEDAYNIIEANEQARQFIKTRAKK